MPVISDKFQVNTKGDTDIVDITEKVKHIVYKHGLRDGAVLVYVSGSTSAITTIEYEPGLLKDLPEAMERIAPADAVYHHDDTWHDGNGHAHIRASIIGSSITVPLQEGALNLGTWQQIVLIDFDNKQRLRNVTVQVIY